MEKLARDTGRSRFPVTTLRGHVTGLVHVRDAIRATTTGQHATVRD